MKSFGFFLFLSLANAANPQWVDAPVRAPNIRLLIHRSSQASTFTVQAPSPADARVLKLFKQFATEKSEKIESLAPSECYELKRGDLESLQTWCRASNGAVRTFIELGSQKLSAAEKLEIQLKTLSEAK